MKRVFVTVVLAMGIVVVSERAQATLILYAPTTAAASTEYTGYGVVKLFDGAVIPADIGTSNNLNGQYASNGSLPGAVPGSPAVIMDFGSSKTFDSLVYSQRPGGTDPAVSIALWFSSSPYVLSSPGQDTPNPAGAANESLSITELSTILTKYDFVSAHTAQYVFARLYVPSGWTSGLSNVGGSEMRLGAVPEPSMLVLVACGLLSLLAYAWRKRK